MRLEVVPGVSDPELEAIERAVAPLGVRFEPTSDGRLTVWSRAAASEALDAAVPTPWRYARSPRSTRGATRA